MNEWYNKYAVLALMGLLWAFGYYAVDWTKIDSPQWAAWVQAIGSVLAILVAVGVAWHQGESQRRREDERALNDGNALLRCLRADMTSHLEQVHTGFSPIINATGPGQPVLSMFPVPEDPFSMYNALLPKLGIIQDDNLRVQIVRSCDRTRPPRALFSL